MVRRVWFVADKITSTSPSSPAKRAIARGSTRTYGSPSAWLRPTERMEAVLHLLEVENDLTEADLGAQSAPYVSKGLFIDVLA